MRVEALAIPDVLRVEPRRFADERGYFMETFAAERYAEAGIRESFVQDNLSWSRRGVLRGLHFQHPHGQGKLVWVPSGEILDVAVDVRAGSPTFGRSVSLVLSAANGVQVYVPPGFAHGFCVVSDDAVLAYKCTTPYRHADELVVRWDDPALAIDWPLPKPVVSPRDARAPLLAELELSTLPAYAAHDGG